MKVNFEKKKLDNGVTILFEKRNLPVVSISASVKEGFAYEKEKNKGISHFLEHLMFKGTKTRTYKQIAEEIEKKGGILNAYTSEQVTSYWNKLPKKYFTSGINIASDLILNPKLDEIEFEKEKKVILEEIKMYKDNPQLYVIDKIKSLLYKKPFGISGIGLKENIIKFSRKNLADFHEMTYTTDKMYICVVGNTSMEKIEAFAKKFPKTKGKVSDIKPIKINKNLIETRAGVDQANLVFAFHTASLLDKKRYAHEILNAILAGGMSSRLFEEIREKRGLAYAVKGELEQGTNFGYNLIYAGTTKDNAKQCKEIILREIKKIKNLQKKDLEEAKEQLIGLRKVGSEESINVMNSLVQEAITGKPEEFYRYDEKISRIKLSEVRNLSNIKGYSSITLMPKL